ncbi:MAG: hypothetical protein NTZ17_15250 [Phycisphaerae bacterium]|nr:hypothetical protein [Phycisphaerae bacterium]
MKKIIFAVALVALMVPATFAGTGYLTGNGTNGSVDWETTDGGNSTGPFEVKGENYNWPATYDFVTAATIRVRMEVGFWIKFNTKDAWLTLKQVEIHKYAGSVTFAVQNNVNVEVHASFAKLDGMPGMEVDSLSLNEGGDTAQINAPGANLKVYLKIKNVDLSAFNADTQVGKCIQIGLVTLTVRPLVRPNIAGVC